MLTHKLIMKEINSNPWNAMNKLSCEMTMGQTVFIKTTTKITLQILGSRVWRKSYRLSEFDRQRCGCFSLASG